MMNTTSITKIFATYEAGRAFMLDCYQVSLSAEMRVHQLEIQTSDPERQADGTYAVSFRLAQVADAR